MSCLWSLDQAVLVLREVAPKSFRLHQGFESSRCFKVQRPGAAEIRFLQLIRLRCGGSLGEAENTEAREGGQRAEQEVPHQSERLASSSAVRKSA